MRRCSECNNRMNEGYCIESGLAYYCSSACLHKHYTEEEWNELYTEDGDSYWTEWEEDICDSCHEEFPSDEMEEVESQGELFCSSCYDEWRNEHEK
jgi:predicted CXXCH cytochrome family protein